MYFAGKFDRIPEKGVLSGFMNDLQNLKLTKKAFRLLEQIYKGKILYWDDICDTADGQMLVRYSLIYPSPKSEVVRINNDGEQVFLRIAQENQSRKATQTHNWRIAIFSALCGALLSSPFWSALKRLIAWILQQI